MVRLREPVCGKENVFYIPETAAEYENTLLPGLQ